MRTNVATKRKECNSKIGEFKLPIEESERSLIKIKKIRSTNKKYPRRNAEIKNNPL